MTVFVTGAAGFVGSHICERLVGMGHKVRAFDRVPPDAATNLRAMLDGENIDYVTGNFTDLATVAGAMHGTEVVWHFAASADIPAGAERTDLDLSSSVLGTRAVLEAMRRCRVHTLVFPSSSAVYGFTGGQPVSERRGPLLPMSLYGAAKLGAEGLVSSYCHTFGLRAIICRLGNVVGGRMARGVVRDFILKLLSDPCHLRILGSGRQRKSYVLVDDCIDGMLHLLQASRSAPCDVYNVAAGGSLGVFEVGRIVAVEMGLRPVLSMAGDAKSWPGDQEVVELDVSRAADLGWRAAYQVDEAVRIAARRMLAELAPDAAVAGRRPLQETRRR